MTITEKEHNMNPKISIIIPVYNTEAYLRECLDSVINQTYKDIEIIIVNDCSPDNSEEIILKYQQNDPRIKYIKHKVNKGTYHARETGAIHSSGDYLLYIDPDDFIDLKLCEKLIPLINQNPECIVYNIQVLPHDKETENKINRNLQNFTEPYSFFNALTNNTIKDGALYQKVYKREILVQVYQELNLKERLIMAEDVLVNIWASYYCTAILYLDFFGYTYRQQSDSITNKIYDLNQSLFHLDQLFIVNSQLLLFCKQKNLSPSIMNPVLKKLLDYYFFLSYNNNVQYQDILIPKILSSFDPQLVIPLLLEKFQNDKWYNFGQLSRKHKIKKIIVVLSKKLHIYLILKKIYYFIKR